MSELESPPARRIVTGLEQRLQRIEDRLEGIEGTLDAQARQLENHMESYRQELRGLKLQLNFLLWSIGVLGAALIAVSTTVIVKFLAAVVS